MEQYGNASTFNLESVLVQNIKSSHYYIKKALDLDSVHEVIDEIYETVDHIEPWLSGNARGPSSAFCLIFRLGELKPSPPEIREMIDHHDSPYIRAIGFLYLRYCCNPRDLWSWFKKYMRDDEKFTPSPANFSKTITIGTFARDILLDQYYFETLFPRIPKTVTDEVCNDLRAMNLPTTALGNAAQGGPDRRGTDEGSRRPASVKASLAVALGQRAPNRAGARELGRGMGSDQQLDRGRGGGDRGRGGGMVEGQEGPEVEVEVEAEIADTSLSTEADFGIVGIIEIEIMSMAEEEVLIRVAMIMSSSHGAGGYRGGNDRNYDNGGGGGRRGSRSSSQSPREGVGGGGGSGRDVRDVFRERPAAPVGGKPNSRNNY
ncbi:hypothetical protein Ndes2526B_g00475 [Nannochloris sp. 'desiccata']